MHPPFGVLEIRITKKYKNECIGLILEYLTDEGLVVDGIIQEGNTSYSGQFKVGDEFISVNGLEVIGQEEKIISILLDELDLHIKIHRVL